jgi:hypothetical protein
LPGAAHSGLGSVDSSLLHPAVAESKACAIKLWGYVSGRTLSLLLDARLRRAYWTDALPDRRLGSLTHEPTSLIDHLRRHGIPPNQHGKGFSGLKALPDDSGIVLR